MNGLICDGESRPSLSLGVEGGLSGRDVGAKECFDSRGLLASVCAIDSQLLIPEKASLHDVSSRVGGVTRPTGNFLEAEPIPSVRLHSQGGCWCVEDSNVEEEPRTPPRAGGRPVMSVTPIRTGDSGQSSRCVSPSVACSSTSCVCFMSRGDIEAAGLSGRRPPSGLVGWDGLYYCHYCWLKWDDGAEMREASEVQERECVIRLRGELDVTNKREREYLSLVSVELARVRGCVLAAERSYTLARGGYERNCREEYFTVPALT